MVAFYGAVQHTPNAAKVDHTEYLEEICMALPPGSPSLQENKFLLLENPPKSGRLRLRLAGLHLPNH